MSERKSRVYITPPEFVVPWRSRMEVLKLISYERLLEMITPNEAAIDFAARFGLIANTKICPRCGQRMLIWNRKGLDGIQWRCMYIPSRTDRVNGRRRNYCSSLSIRHGSIFRAHHLSIADILEFMYMWARNYPLCEIRVHTHFGSEMAVSWAAHMRTIAAAFVDAQQVPLGGPNMFVEIGKMVLYKARHAEEHPFLLGAVERGSGNCIIEVVEDVTIESLEELITKWILPGTILISDRWLSCGGRLQQLGYPYHFVVDEKVEMIGLLDDGRKFCASTKLVQELCSQAKEKFLAMNGTCRAHFESYIKEFLFRRVFHDDDIFAGLVCWAPLLFTG